MDVDFEEEEMWEGRFDIGQGSFGGRDGEDSCTRGGGTGKTRPTHIFWGWINFGSESRDD